MYRVPRNREREPSKRRNGKPFKITHVFIEQEFPEQLCGRWGSSGEQDGRSGQLSPSQTVMCPPQTIEELVKGQIPSLPAWGGACILPLRLLSDGQML